MNKKPSLSSTFKLLNAPPQLGELLVKAGLINQTQLDEIAKASQYVPARLGQMLVMAGYINHVELQNALQVQCLLRENVVDKQKAVQALHMTRWQEISLQGALAKLEWLDKGAPSTRLGDLLVEAGALTPDQLEDALDCNQSSGLPLGRVLVLSGMVTDRLLLSAMNAQALLRQGAIERADAIRAIASARDLHDFDESEQPPAFGQTPAYMNTSPTPAVDDTVTLPARDTFMEQLLIESGIVQQVDFARAMQAAYEQKCDVARMLAELEIIEWSLLEMAQEMKRLVEEKFVDIQWCIHSLKIAYKDREEKGAAVKITPPDGNGDNDVEKSPTQYVAPKEFTLPDFMVLCKVASREQIERAQNMCLLAETDMTTALVQTHAVMPETADLVERCFKLVQKNELTLDEAIFAFDFCNRRVVEQGEVLINVAELLAFQTGIWALHDSLTAR